MNKAERLVRWPEVKQRTGLSRTTTWRMIRNKTFPAPIKLTDHAVGWRQSDLDAWIASRRSAA
jgi:prophage regulatory protein